MIWCPYSDSELNPEETSPEHILPLSLGGINGFELPVGKDVNANAGSWVDGAVANDFFIALRRNAFDIRGHSKKRPSFTAKNSSDASTGAPLQVTFDRHAKDLNIWCPITQSSVGKHGAEIQSNIMVKMYIDIRFVAKTALSAGYFVYGDLFRKSVKHNELRTLMHNDLCELDDELYALETRADGRFSSDREPHLQVLRALAKAAEPSSIVGLVPGPCNLTVFVGVLGMYMGMVNVPADTHGFPNEAEHDLGHVICPQEGELKRASFRRCLEKLQKIA